MRNRNPWAEAHLKLKRLYEERVPPNMTQRDFGKRYGIGSQSMVAQYLNGDRPLNFEAAAKFSKGLGCTIYDICPDMVEEILPVLGKTWRRAATVLLCLLIPTLQAPDAKAAGFDITFTEYTLHALRRLLSKLVRHQGFLTTCLAR